jgi:phosphatidylglycerophosphatase A
MVMAGSASGWAASCISTVCGLGRVPVAPGTAGSLGAIGLAYALVNVFGWKPWHFAVLSAVILGPSVWAANRTAMDSGSKDPSKVVIDEVIGQWVTLAGAGLLVWQTWLAAFVLFRLFDIWKPPPVRRAEALPGGVGIVADDVVAGLYGALVLFAAGCFNFE